MPDETLPPLPERDRNRPVLDRLRAAIAKLGRAGVTPTAVWLNPEAIAQLVRENPDLQLNSRQSPKQLLGLDVVQHYVGQVSDVSGTRAGTGVRVRQAI